MKKLFIVTVGLFMVACQGSIDRSVDGDLISTGRPIIDGTPDYDHPATVALTQNTSGNYFCSGTLIADNVVLTAAHCTESFSPSQIYIFFGNSVYESGTYRSVSDIKIHPNWNSYSLDGDISLVFLSSSAPAGYDPVAPLPASMGLSSADVGETLVFSGFGQTETGSSGVKLKASGTIGNVCTTSNDCSMGSYEVKSGAIGYYQQTGGPCFGDSGGPAYIMRNGQEYVGGVTSYGDQNCAYYGVSTSASYYADWIESYVNVPDVEDCENGLDDDGDGQVDCADADCASHPACVVPDEICDNGIDDDGDGQVDCADGDCNGHPSCTVPVEDCDNGADDDGDGQVDCADADCAAHPSCQDPGELIELQNGVAIANLDGNDQEWVHFGIQIPDNAIDLVIRITGGDGDADLYTLAGTQPDRTNYDCRPYRWGNEETCTFDSPVAGWTYISLHAYSAFSGVTLVASFEVESDTDDGIPVVDIGDSFGDLYAARGEWIYGKIYIPAGTAKLTVVISGGSGDADLYLQAGALPTKTEYDCRPYRWGNNETCSISNPPAGYMYLGLQAYSAFSGVDLDIY